MSIENEQKFCSKVSVFVRAGETKGGTQERFVSGEVS